MHVKGGLKFSGKAVKNLAGSGCDYVRMMSDLFTTVLSSDSSDDLPNVDVKSSSKSEESVSSSQCSSKVHPSTPYSTRSHDIHQTSCTC